MLNSNLHYFFKVLSHVSWVALLVVNFAVIYFLKNKFNIFCYIPSENQEHPLNSWPGIVGFGCMLVLKFFLWKLSKLLKTLASCPDQFWVSRICSPVDGEVSVVGKVTSVDETPNSSFFNRKMLEVIFPFPPYLMSWFLSIRTALPFLLHLHVLHIFTLSFLNTQGSSFVTVVLVRLNNTIEEINYASVCMLYDGSDMKVLMILQHCIWCSVLVYEATSDPDVMWQHSAIIFKGPVSKKGRTHEDDGTMWLASVAFWLVNQYPIPEEWSPQVICNLKSESVHFRQYIGNYSLYIIWFCHLGIHGAFLINLYLAYYVFMLKLYSILWWWTLMWIFYHNPTMCLVLFNLI
jgi:hypothetical protein